MAFKSGLVIAAMAIVGLLTYAAVFAVVFTAIVLAQAAAAC